MARKLLILASREPIPDRLLETKELPRFLESLTDEQQRLLSEALYPHPVRDLNATYPEELAQRWVFERVLELGWTPEKFDQFDCRYGGDWGRSERKVERFGKKYQWIALRELLARIAENFHTKNGFDDQPVPYAGPWQFFGRDVDPTLPPPLRKRNKDGESELSATFTSADRAWWNSTGPHYRHNDPQISKDWAVESDDIPEFESLVRKKDQKRTRWVVLHAYYNWDEEVREDEERRARTRRNLWSHIYSWLVQPADMDALVAHLEQHSLFGRWMPEGLEHPDGAYLGELPWAASAGEDLHSWRKIRSPADLDPMDLAVYPAWAEYLWGGAKGLTARSRIASMRGSLRPSYSKPGNSAGCQALANGVGRMAHRKLSMLRGWAIAPYSFVRIGLSGPFERPATQSCLGGSAKSGSLRRALAA